MIHGLIGYSFGWILSVRSRGLAARGVRKRRALLPRGLLERSALRRRRRRVWQQGLRWLHGSAAGSRVAPTDRPLGDLVDGGGDLSRSPPVARIPPEGQPHHGSGHVAVHEARAYGDVPYHVSQRPEGQRRAACGRHGGAGDDGKTSRRRAPGVRALSPPLVRRLATVRREAGAMRSGGRDYLRSAPCRRLPPQPAPTLAAGRAVGHAKHPRSADIEAAGEGRCCVGSSASKPDGE